MLSEKDDHMLQRLLSRDEQALYEFYQEHKGPLQQYLMRKLDPEDAEEVFQDSCIAFVESLRNFKRKSSLKTFLYSIAKRKAIDKLRRKSFKRVLFSYFPEYVIDSLAKVFMTDNLDKKYLASKIKKAMDTLPHDYAHILRLKYVEGYKVDEIAKEVDITHKAAESLLFRARKAFIHTYTEHERQGVHTFEESL